MARACRTSAASLSGRACSPPDHPARLKVEIVSRQVSWLAPYRPCRWNDAFPRLGAVAVSIRVGAYSCGGSRGLNRVPVLAPANAGEPRIGKATQWPAGGQPWRVSVCGQPFGTVALACGCGFAHEELLGVFQARPFTTWPAEGAATATLQIDAMAPPCFACTLRSGAPQGVKREIGNQADAAPATVSERSILTTVPRRMAWEGDAFQEPCSSLQARRPAWR